MPNFTIDPATGAGRTTITVTPSSYNSDGEDRVSTLTLSNPMYSKQVTLTQKYVPVMTQIGSRTFPASGGSLYFTVDTDYDIVFRSVPDWIEISRNGVVYSEGQRISSGVANHQGFTLTAEPNTGNERSVGSTFNMGHYIGNALQNRVSYFSLTQLGSAVPSITISPTLVQVSSAGTSATLTMSVENCTYSGMTTSSAGSFTIRTHTPLHGIISLTFPANDTEYERRGYITFYVYDTSGNTYTSTVTVVQAAAAPEPTGTFYLNNYNTYSIYGNITTGDTYGTGNITVESQAGSSSAISHTVPFFMDSLALTLQPQPTYPSNISITLRNFDREGSITAYFDDSANAWLGTGWIDIEQGDTLDFELNV